MFDLDGTLADGKHREHHLAKSPKDWDCYFEACGGDTPIWHALEVFRCLWYAPGGPGFNHKIEIWSGRSEGEGGGLRRKTLTWLRDAASIGFFDEAPEGVFFSEDPRVHIRMRPYRDHRPDIDLKREWLTEARAADRAPDLVFDDRDSVVAMWRAEGIPCFQVAPGDF